MHGNAPPPLGRSFDLSCQSIQLDYLYLCDIHIVTPLGITPEFVHAAVKAEISAYQMSPLPGDQECSVKFSLIPDAALNQNVSVQIPGLSAPQLRALKIAFTGLSSLLSVHSLEEVPFFLAGPDSYYDQNTFNSIFVQQLINAAGVSIEYASSRYFAAGRAGFFYALDAAFDYLAEHPRALVLVSGVDTYYDARTLGLLRDKNRLSDEGVYDGFVPAEGAAFLLLSTGHGPEELVRRAKLKMARPSMAYEPGHILSEKPQAAHSLSVAMADALGSAQVYVDKIYTSENGESYYGQEFTVARLRNCHKLQPDVPICRIAEFAGDTGAAYPGVALALAAIDSVKSKAQSFLICGSSDTGARGAVFVTSV